MNQLLQGWRAWILPLALLVLWQASVSLGWVDARVLVAPVRVLESAWAHLRSGELPEGMLASLARNLAGFTIGSTAGVALGGLLALSRTATWVVAPTVTGLKHISIFAWLPLISSVLGNGELAKGLFIALAAFYPTVLATRQAFAEVERSQLEVARVYGFTPAQRLWHVLLPASAPRIFAGLQVTLLLSWMATIGAEYLLPAFTPGVGNIVMRGRAAFHVEAILVGLLAVGLVGAALSQVAHVLERRWLHWRR